MSGQVRTLLTVDEVAERLKVTPYWVREMSRNGKLPFARKLGKFWRYSEAGLNEWMEGGE